MDGQGYPGPSGSASSTPASARIVQALIAAQESAHERAAEADPPI